MERQNVTDQDFLDWPVVFAILENASSVLLIASD
jgi:hypothetical protein